MQCGLRILGVAALGVAMVSVTACQGGGMPSQRISVRPGTTGAQAIAAADRQARAEAAKAEPAPSRDLIEAPSREPMIELAQDPPRASEPGPATQPGRSGVESSSNGEWARSDDKPAPSPTRPRPTADAPTPVDRPAPMGKTERATLREQAIALLVNTAGGGTPEERANAVEALSTTPARLSMILDGALADQSPAVRAVACMAAGKSKSAQAVPLLRRLMQDESRFVRSAAVYGLHMLGQRPDATMLAGMLFDPSPKVRAQGAFIMGEMGEKSALGPLREAAKLPSGRAAPGEVRVLDLQIAEARVKLGDEAALADIRSALFPARPEDLEACVLAIQIVGQIPDRAAVNRLIELTADKDPNKQQMPGEVRVAAAASLAKLGQSEGSYIAREYFAGGNERLRAQAAHLFGVIGRADNLPILARMMTDPDGRVRVAAASAIIRISDR